MNKAFFINIYNVQKIKTKLGIENTYKSSKYCIDFGKPKKYELENK